MEDRFIVRNNSGNILMLPRNRITLAIGARIDLAGRLNKSIQEIKRDPEIILELTHNNLIKEEEFDSSIEAGVDKKLDKLIELMQSRGIQKTTVEIDPEMIGDILRDKIGSLTQNIKSDEEKTEKVLEENEEKMRQEAFMKLMQKKKGEDSNLDTFGGKSKEVESGDDDYSDLIDI